MNRIFPTALAVLSLSLWACGSDDQDSADSTVNTFDGQSTSFDDASQYLTGKWTSDCFEDENQQKIRIRFAISVDRSNLLPATLEKADCQDNQYQEVVSSENLAFELDSDGTNNKTVFMTLSLQGEPLVSFFIVRHSQDKFQPSAKLAEKAATSSGLRREVLAILPFGAPPSASSTDQLADIDFYRYGSLVSGGTSRPDPVNGETEVVVEKY